MFLPLNSDEFYETEVFTRAGRALCLCQHFEFSCKEIVMWMVSTKSFRVENKTLQRHFDYVDKLNRLSLGLSQTKLKEYFGDEINKEFFQVLDDARNSRNYICHDLLHPQIVRAYSVDYSSQPINRFGYVRHLFNIACGDYLVCRWSLAFHNEQHSLPSREKYIRDVITWVLASHH